MKINDTQLANLIKEELRKTLNEVDLDARARPPTRQARSGRGGPRSWRLRRGSWPRDNV